MAPRASGTTGPTGDRSSARDGAAWPDEAPRPCATASITAPTRTPPRAADGRGSGPTSSSLSSSYGSTTGASTDPERLRPPAHRPVREPDELPADIAQELATAAGPDWNFLRDRISERMAAGIGAYERERYRDAARILRTVVDAVPNAPSPRELLGLCQYHQGNWKAALPNLEMFATLTGSVDQHPVRMDCHRALGRPKRVEALFDELRKGSPDPEVLSEGRLVLAGTRADLGDLDGAVSPAGRRRGRPPGPQPGRAAPAPVVRVGRPDGAVGRPGQGPGAVPAGPGRRPRRLRRGRPARIPRPAHPGPPAAEPGPRRPLGSAPMSLEQLLGDEAEIPAEARRHRIPRPSLLTLPGPGVIDDVFRDSDRSPTVLRNLGTLYSTGRLAGTGYLSILPVDQGIEHSAAASFAKFPAYFDPARLCDLAIAGRLQRHRHHPRRARHRVAAVRAPDPVHRQAEPQRLPQLPEHLRPGHVRRGPAGRRPRCGGRRGHHLLRLRGADRQIVEVGRAFAEAHRLGMFTVLWCYLRNPAFKQGDTDYHLSADLTGQANHLGVTIEADIIKQKQPENNGGYNALKFGKTDPLVYSRTDHRPPDRPDPLAGRQLLRRADPADQLGR